MPALSAPKTTGRSRRYINIVLVATLIFAVVFLQGSGKDNPAETQRIDMDGARLKADKLDHHYLSRLVSEANRPGVSHQVLRGETPEPSNYTATVVIGRMVEEEVKVQWVYDKLYNIQDRQIYLVDDNTTDGPHLDTNHGREAAVYLKYIVENYDNLTDISFFWHTDEVVWHNNLLMGWNSVEEINRMDRGNIMKQGYVPSRCDHWPGCPTWIHFDPSKAEHNLDPHRLESLFNLEIFSEIFPDVTEFPPYFAGTCCSQFAVSRDQIRSRPKSQYERLLKWAVEYEDDAESGRVFEYTWPFIFTGRGTWCPSMQECYCKTYNFCMENQDDVAAVERWNSLRTRREEVQWQLNFIKDALETKQTDAEASGASSERIVALEDAFAPEIEKLSDNLAYLTQTTWQAREDIIHYWKLGAPPVGW